MYFKIKQYEKMLKLIITKKRIEIKKQHKNLNKMTSNKKIKKNL